MLKKLFEKTKQEIVKLNNEYEQMSKENKIMSSKISTSIQDKSEKFSLRKRDRERMFDSIHKK